jgi:hypothetical protein
MRATAAALSRAAVPAAAIAAYGGPEISKHGVGDVTLGATYRHVHRAGLVGRLRPGCELEGPKARSARLEAPLEGSVDFKRGKPRRVRNITITGGTAQANGVGIGATIKQIKHAYPDASVDHGTDATRGFTLVVVQRGRFHASAFAFAVDTSTHHTSRIGIPYLQECD